jgi:hypothetical protein
MTGNKELPGTYFSVLKSKGTKHMPESQFIITEWYSCSQDATSIRVIYTSDIELPLMRASTDSLQIQTQPVVLSRY